MHTDHARVTLSCVPAPPLSSPCGEAVDDASRAVGVAGGEASAARAARRRSRRGPRSTSRQVSRSSGMLAYESRPGVRGQLLVDHLGYRHPRLGVLGERDVAEGAQRRRLLVGEEAQRGRGACRRASTTSRVASSQLLCGVEHVVIGIAADHLRGRAPTLARQPARLAGLAVARAGCGRWSGLGRSRSAIVSPPVAAARPAGPSRRRSSSAPAP